LWQTGIGELERGLGAELILIAGLQLLVAMAVHLCQRLMMMFFSPIYQALVHTLATFRAL